MRARSSPIPLLLAVLAACTAANAATPAPGPAVARAESAATPDTAATRRYVVHWPAVSDANGPATSYLDSVTVAGQLVHAYAGAATADTVTIPVPPAGGSTTVNACVRAVRRALVSTPGCISWKVTTADVAPPSPAPVVDSSALASLSFQPDSLEIAPGDSALVTAVGFDLRGDTVHLASIEWAGSDSVIMVRPVPGSPSAWVVVSPDAVGDAGPGSALRLVLGVPPISKPPLRRTSVAA